RISWNRPETPDFLAGLRVIGGESAAHGVIRTVVAHENLSLGNPWRARDAGLQGLADGGFPDFFRGGGINGNQTAVSGANINFSIPYGYASVGARGVRTIQRQVEPDLGIVFPDELPRGGLHRVDLGERS